MPHVNVLFYVLTKHKCDIWTGAHHSQTKAHCAEDRWAHASPWPSESQLGQFSGQLGTDTWIGSGKMLLHFGVTGIKLGSLSARRSLGSSWGHWVQKGHNYPNGHIVPRFVVRYLIFLTISRKSMVLLLLSGQTGLIPCLVFDVFTN